LIKALFFYLDGTLLNGEGNLSERTKEVLWQCKKAGIRLFIATARPPFAPERMPWREETMALFDGALYCNGGQIDVAGQKYYNPVPQRVVRDVVKIALRYEGFNGVLQLEQYKNAFIRPEFSWESNQATLEEAKALRTLKMLLFYGSFHDTTKLIDAALLEEILAACQSKAEVYVTDLGKAIQINAAGITKGSSVAKICEIIGVMPNEIATFGDDTNDIEMLRFSPNSFAMGNATAEVQESAAHVTHDNNQDGIAHAITSILKLV
jgi:Cof subfamily protein (haloacid dehalogenase superfamily)